MPNTEDTSVQSYYEELARIIGYWLAAGTPFDEILRDTLQQLAELVETKRLTKIKEPEATPTPSFTVMENVRPTPAETVCVWDSRSQKYVPVSSHRGVEIQEIFRRINSET